MSRMLGKVSDSQGANCKVPFFLEKGHGTASTVTLLLTLPLDVRSMKIGVESPRSQRCCAHAIIIIIIISLSTHLVST